MVSGIKMEKPSGWSSVYNLEAALGDTFSLRALFVIITDGLFCNRMTALDEGRCEPERHSRFLLRESRGYDVSMPTLLGRTGGPVGGEGRRQSFMNSLAVSVITLTIMKLRHNSPRTTKKRDKKEPSNIVVAGEQRWTIQ